MPKFVCFIFFFFFFFLFIFFFFVYSNVATRKPGLFYILGFCHMTSPKTSLSHYFVLWAKGLNYQRKTLPSILSFFLSITCNICNKNGTLFYQLNLTTNNILLLPYITQRHVTSVPSLFVHDCRYIVHKLDGYKMASKYCFRLSKKKQKHTYTLINLIH